MPNSAISFNTAGLASATSPGLVGTGAQTFAGAKTFQNGLVFPASSLSDEQATILGLKQYVHGTAYNGGIAPTVTCAQSGFTVARAVFVPSQMQAGTWRLRFNIEASFTSATVTVIIMLVNGVVFKDISSRTDAMACCGFWGGLDTPVPRAFAYNSNSNRNEINVRSSSAVGAVGAYVSGDVELESKPTWAY